MDEGIDCELNKDKEPVRIGSGTQDEFRSFDTNISLPDSTESLNIKYLNTPSVDTEDQKKTQVPINSYKEFFGTSLKSSNPVIEKNQIPQQSFYVQRSEPSNHTNPPTSSNLCQFSVAQRSQPLDINNR